VGNDNTLAANAVPATANGTANVTANQVATPANETANATPVANETANVVSNETANVAANEEPKPRRSAQSRIDQLTAKQRDAEREARYWRELALKNQNQPQDQKPQPPKNEDFQNYDDFLVAKTRFALSQDSVETNVQRSTEAQIAAINETFNARIEEATAQYPDILDIVNDTTLPISPAMAAVIKDSESAPEILVYLDEHRDEAVKIRNMSPVRAAKEIGKLELKLSEKPKPPTKKVSTAPEPVTPVEPKGPQVVDMDKIPMEDFVKRRNQEQFGAKRR